MIMSHYMAGWWPEQGSSWWPYLPIRHFKKRRPVAYNARDAWWVTTICRWVMNNLLIAPFVACWCWRHGFNKTMRQNEAKFFEHLRFRLKKILRNVLYGPTVSYVGMVSRKRRNLLCGNRTELSINRLSTSVPTDCRSSTQKHACLHRNVALMIPYCGSPGNVVDVTLKSFVSTKLMVIEIVARGVTVHYLNSLHFASHLFSSVPYVAD